MNTSSTALMIVDLPFGVLNERNHHKFGDQNWDVAFEIPGIRNMLRSFKTVNLNTDACAIVYHHEDTLPLLKQAAHDEGYVWRVWGVIAQDNKPDPGGRHMIQNCIMWSLITIGELDKVEWYASYNPTDVSRVTFILHSGVSQFIKTAVNEVANPCQKPLSVEKVFIQRHSQESSYVLSLCSGVCSTAAACMLLGRNSVSVDIRQDQCRYGYQRLCGLSEALNSNHPIDEEGNPIRRQTSNKKQSTDDSSQPSSRSNPLPSQSQQQQQQNNIEDKSNYE